METGEHRAWHSGFLWGLAAGATCAALLCLLAAVGPGCARPVKMVDMYSDRPNSIKEIRQGVSDHAE